MPKENLEKIGYDELTQKGYRKEGDEEWITYLNWANPEKDLVTFYIVANTLLSNIRLGLLLMVQILFLSLSFGAFKLTKWTPIVAIILASLQGLCYVYWLPHMINATRQFESIPFKALTIDTFYNRFSNIYNYLLQPPQSEASLWRAESSSEIER